jgi:hypothetical protein
MPGPFKGLAWGRHGLFFNFRLIGCSAAGKKFPTVLTLVCISREAEHQDIK